MPAEESRRLEELSLLLREQRAIYRIARSDDGVLLADRLNAMLDESIGEMIASDDPIHSEVMKGKCRGISDVIRIFAEIEAEVIDTEELIQIERSEEQI